MKRIKTRAIINLLVITISIFIPMSVSNAAYNSRSKRYTVNFDVQKTVDTTDVNDLVITTGTGLNGDLIILTEDREDIKIEIKGSAISYPKIKQPSIKISKDKKLKKLDIGIEPNNDGVLFEMLKLSTSYKLYIPKDYNNNLVINNNYGNTTISDINLNTYTLNLQSGNAKLKKVKAKKIDVDASYGNVFFENCEGNISCKNISGNTSLVVDNLKDDIYAKVVYGNIKCDIEQSVKANVNSSTTYGTITSKIPYVEDDIKSNESGLGYSLVKKDSNAENTIELEAYSGTITISSFDKNETDELEK